MQSFHCRDREHHHYLTKAKSSSQVLKKKTFNVEPMLCSVQHCHENREHPDAERALAVGFTPCLLSP